MKRKWRLPGHPEERGFNLVVYGMAIVGAVGLLVLLVKVVV